MSRWKLKLHRRRTVKTSTTDRLNIVNAQVSGQDVRIPGLSPVLRYVCHGYALGEGRNVTTPIPDGSPEAIRAPVHLCEFRGAGAGYARVMRKSGHGGERRGTGKPSAVDGEHGACDE